MKQVVLITGASSGMGKATAQLLAEKDYIVYGVARDINKMDDLIASGIRCISMDITKEESIQSVLQTIYQEEGRIDILINNAGFGQYGSIEEVPMEKARYQLEVNLIGMARITQLVIPGMRKQNYGKIINISSVGGKVVGLFGGWYHISKFGVEALSDSLRLELKAFNIEVINIQPGGIKTKWDGIAMDNLNQMSGQGVYKASVAKVITSNQKLSKKYSDPIVIASLILKVLTAKNPKPRYHAGYMAGLVLFLKKLLPDRIFDKIILSQLEA